MDGQAIDTLILRLREHVLAREAARLAAPSGPLGPMTPREQAESALHELKLEMRGGVVPDLDERMAGIVAMLQAPVPLPVRAPVSHEALDGAEAQLGFALPPVLRRAYGEVADGGFGPGAGMQPLDEVVGQYLDERSVPVTREHMRWPEQLLPLQDSKNNPVCIDAADGALFAISFQDLRRGPDKWQDAIRPVSPDLGQWLSEWLDRA